MRTAHWLPTGSLLILLTAFGCVPGVEKGQVRGKVFFRDRMLESGTVRFIGPDGKPSWSVIGPDGTYQVSDVAPGTATITVVSHGRVPKGFKAVHQPPGKPPGIEPIGPEEKPIAIPSRYGQPGSSELRFTVQPGKQKYDVKLTP
jgi:hypothetical protein